MKGFAEITVSGTELLAARERRADYQAAAVSQFGKPVLSITMITPGPMKDGWLPQRAMEIALLHIDTLITANGWQLLSRDVFWRSTGPEAIYVIDVQAHLLKTVAVELEGSHPIGRLWDLDVIAPDGVALSRTQLAIPARGCLVCDRPARECGRSQKHSLAELLTAMLRMVEDVDRHRRT
ncbi:citrate lyase holo-[acyl-carrier protein] synthase [Edaphobacter sp. HDX4]|uniref:citrate lyase holo-[acyl-carrier protein] synthase n=1 Tax=Edaphobacter sp. HDX4 TaxID=2794064 RepID=UPI002FE61432